MLSTETIIGDNIMSENEFNINIEPIITELNLQPIDNFLYSREGFP